MNKAVHFLNLDGRTNQKKNVTWNIVANILAAGQTFAFLLLVTRVLGADSAGIFSFAFAVAALQSIPSYGISDYQATDVREKYKLHHYFWLRLFLCAAITACSLLYLCLGNYAPEKTAVVLLIVFMRAVDSVDNVFNTMFLQKGRLECGAKLTAVRIALSYICFLAAILITENLVQTCCFLAITYLLIFLAGIRLIFPVLKGRKWGLNRDILSLAGECAPLFFSSFSLIYITNLPKYSIDYCLTEELQGHFAILFLPVNIINLMSAFVLRPILTKLSFTWEKKDYQGFCRIILKYCLMLFLVILIFIILGRFPGLTLLSLFYGIDLNRYWQEFLILLFAGGINAIVQFLTAVITTMRYAKQLLFFYASGAVFGTLLAVGMAKGYGMLGIAVQFMAMQLMLLLCFAIFVYVIIRKAQRKRPKA